MLESFLTTIPKPDERPEKLAGGYLGARIGTKVTIPWLDRRRCEGITLRMDEPVVDLLMKYGAGPDDPPIRDKTLEIALKTYYRRKPVFHGVLATPKYDFIAGTVELAACDPSLRLERAILIALDKAVTEGVTIDGAGMFSLLASAQNPAAHDALGWPVLGIIPGADRTTDSDALFPFQRLDKIWNAIKTLADAYDGPDFELEPIESDPAELASGTDIDSPSGAINGGAGTITEFTIVVARVGEIGGLRLGIWATHDDPTKVDVDVVHPDGTVIRIWTGSRATDLPADDWLGTSATLADLARFETGPSVYSDDSDPRVGTFRSKLSQLWGKDAPGIWKLRFTAHSTDTGTLEHWRLDFRLPAPAYCRLNVFDKLDTDALPDPVCTFHGGHGQGNARVCEITPRGDLETNQFIANSKAGGTRQPVNDAARADYGTYQDSDSPGEKVGSDALLAWGKLQVGAYSRPLLEIAVAPKDDTGSNDIPRYGVDFRSGSLVEVVGKRGYAYMRALAVVREVVLTQQQSSVRTDMEVVPAGVPAGDLGEE